MVVSLMVRVMAVSSGSGSWFGFQVGLWFAGASGFQELGQRRWPAWAASRGAGRPRSRTRDGLVASGRRSRGTGGHRGPASRACPCPPAAGQGQGDRRLGGGFRVRPVSCRGWSLARLHLRRLGLGAGWVGGWPARADGVRPGWLARRCRSSGRPGGRRSRAPCRRHWQVQQDWSGQSAQVPARSRLSVGGLVQRGRMVPTSAAERMTASGSASGPAGPVPGCGAGGGSGRW